MNAEAEKAVQDAPDRLDRDKLAGNHQFEAKLDEMCMANAEGEGIMQKGEAPNGVEDEFEAVPMNSSEYGDCKESEEGVQRALNWFDDRAAERGPEAE
eukprot:6269050-Alexandrium_andersonii.AAC.1